MKMKMKKEKKKEKKMIDLFLPDVSLALLTHYTVE